ncbi:class I SAM-dependent methyltransferase [Celerinatantimonas sp. YJH-8]|uniref:class I SAM-dependent methyltransferase n=1 Tax=Celerinatantimonas sp. YJH-8 TaxID=3228714 RepID=UPI0038C7088F
MWDEIYRSENYVYGELPNDFLKEHVQQIRGKVLCLADGEGRNSVYLAQSGCHVTAVDLSSVALQKAKQLAQKHQVTVEFICADLAEYDLGQQQWDAIISIFCHLPSLLRQSLHQRICAALKPKGIFLAESYTPKQLAYGTGGPGQADMMLTQACLSEELSSLDFLMLQERERYIEEGYKHHGLSHVVQVIAQKNHH